MDELVLYEEILRLKREGTPAVLAVVVESSGSAPRKAGAKMLVKEDGSVLGTVGGGRLEEETVRAARKVLTAGTACTLPFRLDTENGMVCGGQVLVYLEPLGVTPRLVIVGAGHVGQALARAARPAGFAVTLVDPAAGERTTRVEGFAPPDLSSPAAEIFTRVPVDRHTFIVIAAPSHHDDFLAVRGALATEAAFIGMLGSRRKREALLAFLAEAGLPETVAARVVTPVGLAIGAQTPEEIAISIVAQLIRERRGHAEQSLRDRSGCWPLAADGTQQAAPPAG